MTYSSEKEKDEISSLAISKDDSSSSRVVVERQLRRDWSLAEKRLEMLSAPHTESTTGCILIQFNNYFVTSPLQFGFKKSMSTTLCTGLVKNIAAHYMTHGSPVYSCLLDASKAFDLVDHSILFQQLLDRNTPGLLVHFLITWYSSQSCTVSWDGSVSTPFSVSNGVRQGGVLSPVLFTVYMDILLNMLKDCGVGCYWDGVLVGALGYADDIILLAPCPSALRLMLKTYESFASSFGLKFNASKTQLIRFSLSPSNLCNTQIYFCGQLLEFCNSVCHLGHYLTYNLTMRILFLDHVIFLKKRTYFFIILSSVLRVH